MGKTIGIGGIEMERLTYKGTPYMTEDGMVTPAYSDHSIRRIIERLAEYEDTGLTPTMVLDTIRARDTAQKQALENAHIVDDYRQAEEQGLILRLPCKVGSTVYVKATCECVCMSKDFETGVSECPFEDDCPFEECEDGNERIFKTSVMSIWNNGNGWYFNVRGLYADIAFRDIGTSVFLTREEAEQALKQMGE